MPDRSRRPIADLYVDGFNLYNRAVKGTPYKWLDLRKLARFMLPEYEIGLIRYCTARITARPNDLEGPARQDIYFRALRTLPNLTLHEGFFLATKKPARLVRALSCKSAPACRADVRTAEVWKTEEKGSDVNLAALMLLDAMDRTGDAAFLVSNDSDLTFPLEQVSTRFGRTIGILNPAQQTARALRGLVDPANHRTISARTLAACQFPDTLSDENGTFHKPAAW